MKRYFLSLQFLVFLFLNACNDKDDITSLPEVPPLPALSDDTPLNSRIKQLYADYHVLFKPAFTENEYEWNWSSRVEQIQPGDLGQHYTPAKPEYALPVLDSVENWVFKVFPAEFSARYMPLNILMADSLVYYTLTGYTIVNGQLQYLIEPIPYDGFIAIDYLLLAYTSERFEALAARRALRESWLSLFVEKILERTDIAFPAEFAQISASHYTERKNVTDDLVAAYAFLKPPRTKNYFGNAARWNYMTARQDFADYVAFIVFVPEAEKQTYYAKNPNVAVKEALVKTYLQRHFNLTLPYIPTAQ